MASRGNKKGGKGGGENVTIPWVGRKDTIQHQRGRKIIEREGISPTPLREKKLHSLCRRKGKIKACREGERKGRKQYRTFENNSKETREKTDPNLAPEKKH